MLMVPSLTIFFNALNSLSGREALSVIMFSRCARISLSRACLRCKSLLDLHFAVFAPDQFPLKSDALNVAMIALSATSPAAWGYTEVESTLTEYIFQVMGHANAQGGLRWQGLVQLPLRTEATSRVGQSTGE